MESWDKIIFLFYIQGHHTTGYHNKYHKDEYAKNHKFYDSHHDDGYHGEFKGNIKNLPLVHQNLAH